MNKITVGIPAFNEEKNIAAIIIGLKKITDEIIVCNDGSTDSTGEIAKELGAIVINHEKNLGYGAGIKSIFLKAKEMESDMLVTVDADGQHDVRDISKVITPIQEDKAEIVIGSRFLEKAENIPEYRKFGIKLITKVTNLSLNQSLTDSQSGFRAYSKKVLEKLILSDKGMGISTEILIKANNFDFRIGEVPIKVSYEGETSTENPVSHGTSVLFSTIKYTSIEHPIKFYGIPAIILLLSGTVFTYFAIQYYVEFGSLNTNLTLIGVGLFFIGIVLLITAILLYSLVSVVREGRDN
jgi:glycosyltransferase involved in cell wall biosynthesis